MRTEHYQGHPEHPWHPGSLQAPEATPGDPDGGLSHLAGYLQSNHLGHSSNHDFPYLFIFKENKVPLSGTQAKGIQVGQTFHSVAGALPFEYVTTNLCFGSIFLLCKMQSGAREIWLWISSNTHCYVAVGKFCNFAKPNCSWKWESQPISPQIFESLLCIRHVVGAERRAVERQTKIQSSWLVSEWR